MKLTSLFGKQIFALYEGEIVGTISGAIFDYAFTKIQSFKVFDQDENEFELKIDNIKSMSDCVLISNKNKLALFYDYSKKSPIFKLVLNDKAEEVGKIIDAEINDNGTVASYVTDKNITLLPQNMYPRKDFIYYCENKVNISAMRPRNKKIQLPDIKVKILNFEEQKITNFIPNKIKYNPNSILGKTAKCDLFGINNELIIRANQTITEKIIDDASRHNRLNQLFYLAI